MSRPGASPRTEAELFAHLVFVGKMTADQARHEIWIEEELLARLVDHALTMPAELRGTREIDRCPTPPFSLKSLDFRAQVFEAFDEMMAAGDDHRWCETCFPKESDDARLDR